MSFDDGALTRWWIKQRHGECANCHRARGSPGSRATGGDGRCRWCGGFYFLFPSYLSPLSLPPPLAPPSFSVGTSSSFLRLLPPPLRGVGSSWRCDAPRLALRASRPRLALRVQPVMDLVATDVGVADVATWRPSRWAIHLRIQRAIKRSNSIRRTLQFFKYSRHPRLRRQPLRVSTRARDEVSPLFHAVFRDQ